MPKLRVLIAESSDFPLKAAEVLRESSDLILRDCKDRKELLSEVKNIDILWVRLRHLIDHEVINHAPRLHMIVTPTTGLNHIDLVETEKRGITVLSLRGETDFLKTIRATAEHTIALTLALFRRIPCASHHAITKPWNRDLFKGSEIYGKIVGVLGYGRLGRIVADYFTAFGAKVLTADPNISLDDVGEGISLVTPQTLLYQSDIVSLHVSLTEDTRCFFDDFYFNKMKRGAFFVNTARGELVDEVALLEALESRHIAGAALDVLAGELSGAFLLNPLLDYARRNDNLLITPHIGGATKESMAMTEAFMAKKLAIWLKAKSVGTFS